MLDRLARAMSFLVAVRGHENRQHRPCSAEAGHDTSGRVPNLELRSKLWHRDHRCSLGALADDLVVPAST
jgi:hypothetical protein